MDRETPSVLVVDSNLETLAILHPLFRDEGCRIATFSGGGAALRFDWDHEPDVIFVSPSLLHEDSREIIAQLRRRFSKARIVEISTGVRLDRESLLGHLPLAA